MWTSHSIVALMVVFNLASLASADYDLVYPIVGYGKAGEDYSRDLSGWLQGQVMDVVDGQTTYLAVWKTQTYTIVIAENTFEIKSITTYSEGSKFGTQGIEFTSTKSACTFTGVPVTAAVCDWTRLSDKRSTENHYVIPDTMWPGNNIMYATLTVKEGMATETDLSRIDASGTTQRGSSETVVDSSHTTSAPTQNRIVRVAEAGLPIASSKTSTGRAQGTTVPLIFGVGVAAGLVIGL